MSSKYKYICTQHILDTQNLKLEHFEKNIVTIKTEIDNIKTTQQKQSQILQTAQE